MRAEAWELRMKDVDRELAEAWRQIDAGWFQEATSCAAMAYGRCRNTLGDDHEITRVVLDFYRAVLREHHDQTTARIKEPARLRLTYLAARGVVIPPPGVRSSTA